MSENEISFCSKILLFGEYSIINGGMGIALPFPLFDGKLTFPSPGQSFDKVNESNHELKIFLNYLQEWDCIENIGKFDYSSFEFDIEQGLFFDSTIPQGHGVGSSGSICAAVLDRYLKSDVRREEVVLSETLLNYKNVFSKMESHFHEKSSGIDPLVSYFKRPLLIKNCGELGFFELPYAYGEEGSGALFLVNTKQSRKTAPLVNIYLEKCKQEIFKTVHLPNMLKINDHCISFFLKGETINLFNEIKDLSKFQLEHLTPMIPRLLTKKWQEGLESDDYYLKICGAGGGGFFLGVTKDFDKTRSHFANSGICRRIASLNI